MATQNNARKLANILATMSPEEITEVLRSSLDPEVLKTLKPARAEADPNRVELWEAFTAAIESHRAAFDTVMDGRKYVTLTGQLTRADGTPYQVMLKDGRVEDCDSVTISIKLNSPSTRYKKKTSDASSNTSPAPAAPTGAGRAPVQ